MRDILANPLVRIETTYNGPQPPCIGRLDATALIVSEHLLATMDGKVNQNLPLAEWVEAAKRGSRLQLAVDALSKGNWQGVKKFLNKEIDALNYPISDEPMTERKRRAIAFGHLAESLGI